MQHDKKNQQNETISDKKGSNEQFNKKGEITFMSCQIRLVQAKLDLCVRKLITPMESNVLTLIELGTIGGQNKENKFCSIYEFDITDMSMNLNYKEKDKIYKILKSLTQKGIIHREHTRYKNLEILGLKPEIFGQVLIDSLHETEQNRIRLVVDNSEKQPTNHPHLTDGSSVNYRQFVGGQPTLRRQPPLQHIEITNEIISDSEDIETDIHLRQENKIDDFSQDWANHDPKNFSSIREVLQGFNRGRD